MSDESLDPARVEADPNESRPVMGELDATIVEIRERGPDLAFRLLLVGLLLRLVWPMALPLILGGFASVVLLPTNQRLAAKLGRARGAAPSIVTAASFLCLLLPIVGVGTRVVRAANQFVRSLLASGEGSGRDKVLALLDRILRGSVSHAEIEGYLNQGTRKLASAIGTVLTDVATALPDAITSGFLFLITLYFGLKDGPRLIVWARRVSPVSRARTTQLFVAVDRAARGTLFGMLVVALVQGGLATLAFFAFGVDHAMLWGFVAAICSAIPIVGTTPVTFGAAIFLYAHGRPLAALGMVVTAMLIGVSDNVVRPWVQSQHDDMNPLLALVSIFGGLEVFGPAGLLLGPVIASMAVWALETSPPGGPRADHPAKADE